MMVWYGLIALADHDLAALPALADQCALPQTRHYIARRIAEDVEKNPAPLNELLQITAAKPVAFQDDVLTGMNEAFTGGARRRSPPRGTRWWRSSIRRWPTRRAISGRSSATAARSMPCASWRWTRTPTSRRAKSRCKRWSMRTRRKCARSASN